ncbi:MAG: peptidoglycan DD-metalloendopeptidase family protein, partial [Nitrospirales bacterium]|nr:peptidoglycan DD-metalloendopeptidase family protein [Nitrospirales bacterium]
TGTLSDLERKQAALKNSYAELRSEEKNLSQTENTLEKLKAEREEQLAGVRKQKGAYERMIGELQESSGNLLRIIQESEKREKEQRKKAPARKEEPFEASAFTAARGRLPWPVSGSLAIGYGSQLDPVFNLPVFRSGVHIRTGSGSQVRAVYEGKVVYADSFKGYGLLVIVSHGSGYHSLYGNLSRIFCKNGGIIKSSQAIGEAGESAALGSSGLYFEIRYKGKPLDPQQWLKRQ